MPRVALALAALFAVLLARRAPSKRQTRIALTLVGLFSLDAIRFVSTFFRGSPPYAGVARASWAVSGAGALAWYALTALTAWTVLGREEPRATQRAVVLPWLALPFVMFAAYPAIRGTMFVDVARAAFAFSLAAQALAALRFVSRGRWPDDAQRVALLLAASSLADVAGPWRVGGPEKFWYVGNVTSALTWAAIAGWEIQCLTRARL